MKLQTIRVKNFKNFTSAADGGFIEIALNGKSTVFMATMAQVNRLSSVQFAMLHGLLSTG